MQKVATYALGEKDKMTIMRILRGNQCAELTNVDSLRAGDIVLPPSSGSVNGFILVSDKGMGLVTLLSMNDGQVIQEAVTTRNLTMNQEGMLTHHKGDEYIRAEYDPNGPDDTPERSLARTLRGKFNMARKAYEIWTSQTVTSK